jgi:stage IV sporulation protein FB
VDLCFQLCIERRDHSLEQLLFVVLLFLCLLVHEFGHIFTARAFGVPTPYVTLLPIGGIAQLERIPEEPWEEFLIAIAGPTVNVIAGALIAFAHANPRASAARVGLAIERNGC